MDPRLSNLLSYAVNNCELYKSTSRDPGSISRFPVLTKAAFRTAIPKILTSHRDRDKILAALQGAAAGERNISEVESQLKSDLVVERTSGTSGTPLKIVKTKAERLALSVGIWQYRRQIDPHVSPANFIGFDPAPQGNSLKFHPASAFKHFPYSPIVYTIENVVSLYRWLDEKGIRWIQSPPSIIERHAWLLLEHGVSCPAPAVKFIEMSGSSISIDEIKNVEKATGAKVVNQYGTRELWVIGYAEKADPFNLNSNSVHVELLDDEGNEIQDCDREGSIVATNLVLRLLPIIRYKPGDRGSWHRGPDGVLRLKLSGDRDINIFTFQGRKVSGTAFFKMALQAVYNKIGFTEIRFIQIRRITTDRIKVLASEDANIDAICGCLQEVCRNYHPAVTVEGEVLSNECVKELAMAKPYLFINEIEQP